MAALKDGVYDFISKPFDGERLATAVAHAAEKRRLVLENRRLRAAAAEAPADLPLIGDAPGIRRLRETIRQVADADVDVLVAGRDRLGQGGGGEPAAPVEPPAGAEPSSRSTAARCPRPCSRASSSATRPAPSPAPTAARIGRIEHAERRHALPRRDRACPPAIQVKLLRVLETREVEPLGTNERRRLDLRVVAATKVDLGDPAARGGFREDLYYRLNVVTLRLPPLRERRGRRAAALRALPAAGRRAVRPAGAGDERGGARPPRAARLAGQRARAAAFRRPLSPSASCRRMPPLRRRVEARRRGHAFPTGSTATRPS